MMTAIKKANKPKPRKAKKERLVNVDLPLSVYRDLLTNKNLREEKRVLVNKLLGI